MPATRTTYPARPARLRAFNRWRVLQAVRDKGPVTRAEVAGVLQVSKVTASSVAGSLLRQGLLAETQKTSSGMGRKAGLLDLGPALGVVLALDIDADVIHLTTADLRGEVAGRRTFATPRDLTALVDAIESTVHHEAKRVEPPIHHLGISLPASVTRAGEPEFAGIPHYLDGSHLGTLLSSRLPHLPTLLVNDMNAAALAERRWGAARAWNDFAYLGIRESGIGMGLVLNGATYQGRAGRAGEIGLLRLDTRFENLDAVFANDGKEALQELTTVLATAFTLLDLEGVVLHSDVPRGQAWLCELEERLLRVVPYPIQLRASRLERDGALLGALAMGLDATWTSIEGDVTGVASAASLRSTE